MKPKPVKVIANIALGIEARVWDGPNDTYSVTLFDVDAELTLPTARVGIKTLFEAEAYAKEIAGETKRLV